MKKFLAIMAALLCLSACSSYKDIKFNSFQLEKVSVLGAPLGATVAVEIENPIFGFEVLSCPGVLTLSGDKVLNVTCEPFYVEGHCTQTYHLDLSGTLEPGFGFSNVLKFFQAQDLRNLTLDLVVTAKDPLGFKHTKIRNDLKLWESEVQRQQ